MRGTGTSAFLDHLHLVPLVTQPQRQMSLLLSRPRHINPQYCTLDPPSTRLEDSAPGVTVPSPMTQMVLHCNLIQRLDKKVTISPGEKSPEEVIAFCDEVKSWMATFPPPLRVIDPDKQFDATNPYVTLHRAQLHTIAYAIMLHPLKRHLCRSLDSSATTMEEGLRSAAVDCALSSLEVLQTFFDVVAPLYAKLHFVVFGIFDIGTLLCSAIVHDDARSLPRREAVIASIGSALNMLRRVHMMSKAGSLPYSILRQLVNNLSLSMDENEILNPCRHKKAKTTSSAEELRSSDNTPPSEDSVITTPLIPTEQYPLPQVETSESLLSSELLGNIDNFVDWEGLDLGPQFEGFWSVGADFQNDKHPISQRNMY